MTESNKDRKFSVAQPPAASSSSAMGAGTNSDQRINSSMLGNQSDREHNVPTDGSIRHYELPNLTQLLYDFTNKEQDTILRCFRTGNYDSLRDLPSRLAPANVLKNQRDKQDNNLAWQQPKPRVDKLMGGGLFSDFEWLPDSYDAFLKQKREERMINNRKQGNINQGPFISGMNNFTWKYHDCFLPQEKLKDYVMPYFTENDPYESAEEDMQRAKWLAENKFLAGDFRPAQYDKSLERLTPGQLADMVNYIKKVIMIDWAEVNFIIGTNPDSFIEIKFDRKSIDTEKGLKAYMNTLIKQHEVISQFNLRRVIKFWGHKDNEHVYFMLAPSWIKFNPGITYANILNFQLDDMQGSPRKDGDESSAQQSEARMLQDGMTESTQNLFKIHQLVFKKSPFIKEPVLYSKDIKV